jgi:hypothetical protein
LNDLCGRRIEQRNSGLIDDRDSGSSSGIVSPRKLRPQKSGKNTLKFRTRKPLQRRGKKQQANGSPEGRVASSKTPSNGMTPEGSEGHSWAELEVRIAWIRGHYRQREELLEDQIEKLEETYNLARAELDAEAGEEEAQIDVADDQDDWETKSDYPPTEPRGKSRSPSPVFAMQVRVVSS